MSDEPSTARARVRHAVVSGRLPRVSELRCARCGGQATVYHHADYGRPLDVQPLCRSCHGVVHHSRPRAKEIVTGPSGFVLCADQWRQCLNVSVTTFLRFIGRGGAKINSAQSEWGSLLKGRRQPSQSFARLVLTKAKATDPAWSRLLEDAYTQDALARVK